MEILLTALIVLVVIVLFVLAFVLIRTLTYGKVFEPVTLDESAQVDGEIPAGHLSQVLRCKTISEQAGHVERKAFFELHRLLEKLYPRLHATLTRQVINEYSLLYTWVGSNPELEPVLLMAHLDVVPASQGEWTRPPFSGEIAEGYVWGRGALDIKCQVVGVMETVEGLLKAGFQPERTVMLAFGHDEELGGLDGAAQIVAKLQAEGVHLAAVLDEGGAIVEGTLPGVDVPVAMVGVSEKGYLTLELCVEGQAGHSSAPPAQTAIGILARAVARLEASPLPVRMDMARPMFKAIAPAAPFPMQMAFANTWLLGRLVSRRMAATPQTAATIRTTIAPTMVHAGVKDNILPNEAKAWVNFRLMPGDTIASVCEHARRVIKDERVSFHPMHDSAWEASPVCHTDTVVFRALENTIRRTFGNIPVAPYLVIGATDARYYCTLCDHVYRFMPALVTKAELNTVHGIDERIRVESMGKMVQFYTLLLQEWAGS